MAQTDVQLVIKARNEASAAVLAVADAIKSLVGAQDGLAKGAGQTSSLLDQLRSASTSLAAAVQKTDDTVSRSEAAFQRQNAALAETKQQLAAVTAQMAAADKAAASLNAKFATGPQLAGFTEKLAAVSAEQKNLTAQANALTRSLVAQEAAVEKSAVALSQTRATGRVTGSASTLIGAGSPGAIAENAAEAQRATEINKAFEIMSLEAADALEAEGAAARAAAESVGVFAGSLTSVVPAAEKDAVVVRSLWTQIRELVAAMVQVPAANAAAANSMSEFSGRSSAATQAAHLFRYELLSLAFAFVGPYGVVMAIGEVLKSYQSLQTAQNKLGVVFGQNDDQVTKEMDFLRATSVRLGMSFTQLADQYATISISAQDAGLTLEQNRKLFLSVAEAARVLHLSVDDTDRVFLAFREMMSKGVLYSKQLQNQLGNDIPGAVKLFADAMGLSEQQLTKLMRTGQVFVDSEMMSKIADQLTEKYGKQLPQALESVQTQIGRFKALLEIAAQEIGKGGFMDGLTAALKDLNTELQSSAGKTTFAEIGTALGRIAGIVPFIVHNFDLITLALKAWVTVKLTSWALGFLQSLSLLHLKLEAAMVQMTEVAARAKLMWAALSGVLVGVAVFAIESALGEWLTGIDSATKALDEHNRILDAVKKATTRRARRLTTGRRRSRTLRRSKLRPICPTSKRNSRS